MDTKVVIFNKPIWAIYETKPEPDDPEMEIRNIIEIYGFTMDDGNYSQDGIEAYINYLCGASKWGQEGNDIWDGNKWILTQGQETFIFGSFGPTMQSFQKQAREEMGITYQIYTIDKDLDCGTLCIFKGRWITSPSLWKIIKQDGVLID